MAEEKRATGNPTWKKGVSGNASGKSKTKLLTDALRAEVVQNPQQARNIARKILQLAEEGDLQAANIVFDRLEGKPTQAVEINQTITNLTPEERRQRVIELQSRLVGDNVEDAEVIGGPDARH